MRHLSRPEYSEKYFDNNFEYRQVFLPREVAKQLDPNKLLTESEWRAIGVIQSRGWVHYAFHDPEPYILLFRRPIGTDPKTGLFCEKLKNEYLIKQEQRKCQILEELN